jgi:ketosteroid isomerase-like protein
MDERESFLDWVRTRLVPAENALHDGDAAPRLAIWTTHEPVSVLGAWRNAAGPEEVRQLFLDLAADFSDFRSYDLELVACDVVGDAAYTAALEHTQTSVRGEPRTYTLRATQVYRREDGEWKVCHRHGDTVTSVDE